MTEDTCSWCGDPKDCDERCALDWMGHAVCRGSDTEVFFPKPTRGYGRPRDADYRPAKTICQDCGVQAQCRQYADRHNETIGVWGGLTARELRRLRFEPDAVERTCDECGLQFVGGGTGRRKHCSIDCFRAYRNRLKKGQKRASGRPPGGPVFSGEKRQTPPPSPKTLPEAARSSSHGRKSPATPTVKIEAHSGEIEAT